ncbi:MAG: sulfurtransferase [Pelovirga sp.]
MKRLLSFLLLFGLAGAPAIVQADLGDYFVSTGWLDDQREQVLVLDVRRAPLYWLGHIEGAQHVDRSHFLATRNQVVSMVPTLEAVTALLGGLGATQETPVVVYAEDDNPYAARLVWTLHYHGHKKAYVLDGGYQKWTQEKRPTSVLASSKPTPATYVLAADTQSHGARAETDYIQTRLGHPGAIIWDTRRSAEHTGSEVRADRGGHIPGAIHLDWTDLQKEVDGVKVLKEHSELVSLLLRYGLTSDKEILAHCQTGIRSAYATLVLLGLGYDQVKNYDGSWIEWANNPLLPIVNADGNLESATQTSGKTGSSGIFKR